MRSSVLCLAVAIALCLALPYCNARPDELVVSQKSAKAAAASSSSEEASSETLVKSGGCGCGGPCSGACGSVVASKKSSKKAAAASSSSSSSSYEARSVSGGLLTEVEIKQKYAQLEGESLDTYFKRIVSRYDWCKSNDAYIKTLSIVWKDYSSLPLWYDRKYFSLTKEFYTYYYARLDKESVETYYSRLVTRQAWETEDLFAKRISVLRACFPKLDLWYSPTWFNKYTKTLYSLEYKRWAQESEIDYIKRITARDSIIDKTDDIWANRLFLIQEATISSCDLWYNEKYLSYFKNFYSIWYKKKETETADAWLIRALTLLPNESLENAIKRIRFIKEVTSSYGFWTVDYFKKVQQAKCFQSNWLSLVQKSFFSSCGGAVVERSSSSKASAAASSSSSESSESLKVVKGC